MMPLPVVRSCEGGSRVSRRNTRVLQVVGLALGEIFLR